MDLKAIWEMSDNMVQSATLKFNLKTIGFLVGVRWGEGVLTLLGRGRPDLE